jgi:hypothetical protein
MPTAGPFVLSVEPGEYTVGSQQLRGCSCLRDSATVEGHDQVGGLERRGPVRNHDDGATALKSSDIVAAAASA